MKFDTLRLIGASTVNLPIVGADSSGPFVLKGAEGLDPVEVDVAYADTVEEGGVRQKKRAVNRQIVALIGLQPDWSNGITPQDLRAVLYSLLTPKYEQQCIAQIVYQNVVQAQAKGDISKMEASIFVQDPEVQITLDCDYPYLLATAVQKQTPAKAASDGQTLIDVANDGTAPAGFWMGLTLQQAQVGNLTLSDDSPTGQVMNFGNGWAAGDTLIVDTRPGQRGVWKIKAGTTAKVSALNSLSGDSPWLRLYGGANRLRLNNTAFDWYGDAFVHTPAYWGV